MARAKRESKASGKSKPAQPDRTASKDSQGQNPHRQDETRRSIDGNQGEGNREADRRYREGATNFERSGRVPKAADDARRAIEEDERRVSRGTRDDDDLVDFDDYDDDRSDEEEAKREARDRSRLS
jgi:hypothetical protein